MVDSIRETPPFMSAGKAGRHSFGAQVARARLYARPLCIYESCVARCRARVKLRTIHGPQLTSPTRKRQLRGRNDSYENETYGLGLGHGRALRLRVRLPTGCGAVPERQVFQLHTMGHVFLHGLPVPRRLRLRLQ